MIGRAAEGRKDMRVIIASLVVGFGALSVAVAQEDGGSQEKPEPECDRDINADCRTGFSRPGVEPPPPPNREGAPVDLTGYWVSVVTEDWRWRMMTPPVGDVASLPLNVDAMIETAEWNPETDSGTCKPFGAPGLMRNPMRVRLQWLDDTTLQLDTDHGMQTRRFHFDQTDVEGGPASLQGDSRASWHETGLKVVTTNLSPGYLRKNGVPYSADTVLTEYYDRISVFGDNWLIVTTIVNDPTYLTREFITSTHFKQLTDGSEWNPVACGQS
jgi:hypothetical protein